MELFKILEETRPLRVGTGPVIDSCCSQCGCPLIRTEFSLGFRASCNNHDCPLFRECQGIKVKQAVKRDRKSEPAYQAMLARKRVKRQERIELARQLGIGSYQAYLLRDRTSINIRKYARTK